MWTRKHVLFGVGALIVLEVCAQLLLPYDRAVPLARVGTVRAGLSSRSDLARIFQEQFQSSKVEITSGDRVMTSELAKLGASINNDQMAARLSDYPLWQRLIPFSVLAKQPHLKSLSVGFTGTQLAQQAESIARQLSYQPADASLSLKDGALVVGVAKQGHTVTAGDVKSALLGASYNAGTTKVHIQGKTMAPAVRDADIADAKRQAAEALQRPIVLSVTGKSPMTIDAATKASWLAIDVTVKPAALSVNQEAVTAFVTAINEKVKKAPTAIAVTVVDGSEQGRTEGTPGSSLDIPAVVAELDSALRGLRAATVEVALRPNAPPIIYQRSYSSSQAGLRAYVAYATSTQNVRIVVQQLDGPGWTASGRADESIPSASTYKLYVMMRVFDDINAGRLTWDTPMLDTTAGGCFERTIVPSTNPCAEQWIRQYGRDALNQYVHDKGFSSGTGFTFSDATHTTAGDLARYLIGLNNGTLVGGNNRDMLLEKMSRQLYRYGIPTGTKGWTQDKVGFLWDYIHDAAIVHNPKGTYVLVIMTKGYSYGYIANVAKQIDTILYP